jgi:autotransporter-associated beta strand protein
MKLRPQIFEPRYFSNLEFAIGRSLNLIVLLLLLNASSGIAQTLHWDQNGATAGTGGAGNWGTAGTWRLGSDTGTLQNWDNGGLVTAVLGGTGGQVAIDTLLPTGVTMSALNVDSAGYSIRSTNSTRSLTVTGALTLAPGIGLTLSMASSNPSWSLGSVVFGAGSTLNVTGTAGLTGSNRIELSSTGTISGGSITLAGTSDGPTGLVAYTPTSGSSVQVTLNTNLTNNSATSATMLGANFGNRLTYGGEVSGSASLQISSGPSGGSGVVVLTAPNTYTGDTFLNHTMDGVLRLGVNNAVPTGTTVFFHRSAKDGTLVSAGGTLDLSGFNQTLSGIVSPTTARGVVNTSSPATLTLAGSGTYLFESEIGTPSNTTNLGGANNNITVIKNGSGTQTLSGASSYSGGTTVTGGTLLAKNATGSATGTGAVTTSSGTTLGGTGTLSPGTGNAISVSGSVAPGDPTTNSGVGTLTFTPVNGDASFTSTSTLDFQLLTAGLHGYSATYNPDGTLNALSGSYLSGGNDRLIFNGGASTNKLDFTHLGASNFNVTFASGYTPAALDLFDLLNWANLSGVNDPSAVVGLSETQLDLPLLTGGLEWDKSKWTSHGVIAVYSPIPEPSRPLLLLLGFGVSLRFRRRSVTAE